MDMIISSCYNAGKIINGSGITGNSKGKIINCYNIGECDTGLVGSNQGKIYNSYCISDILNKYLVHYNNYTNSYISKTYYLQSKAIKIAQNYNTGTIDELSSSLTETEMKADSFIMFLNECEETEYSNAWKKDANNINNGYPILRWQN